MSGAEAAETATEPPVVSPPTTTLAVTWQSGPEEGPAVYVTEGPLPVIVPQGATHSMESGVMERPPESVTATETAVLSPGFNAPVAALTVTWKGPAKLTETLTAFVRVPNVAVTLHVVPPLSAPMVIVVRSPVGGEGAPHSLVQRWLAGCSVGIGNRSPIASRQLAVRSDQRIREQSTRALTRVGPYTGSTATFTTFAAFTAFAALGAFAAFGAFAALTPFISERNFHGCSPRNCLPGPASGYVQGTSG